MPSRLDETEGLVFATFVKFFMDLNDAGDHSGHMGWLDTWASFVQLGGHRVGRCADSGLGPDFVLPSLVARAAGRGLSTTPYVEHVHALSVLDAMDLDDSEFAPDGTVWTVALESGGSAGTSLVSGGSVAGVVVRLRGAEVDLFDVSGVARDALPNLGALPLARIDLGSMRPVHSAVISHSGVVDVAADRAVAEASWMVGAAESALDAVVTHVRSRRQFDRPIGSFQALQHRLADCVAQLDGAGLLVERTARLEIGDSRRRRLSASAALYAATTAEHVAREAVQMFGGYGVCEEYAAPHMLRRIKSRKALALDGRTPGDCLPSDVGGRP